MEGPQGPSMRTPIYYVGLACSPCSRCSLTEHPEHQEHLLLLVLPPLGGGARGALLHVTYRHVRAKALPMTRRWVDEPAADDFQNLPVRTL